VSCDCNGYDEPSGPMMEAEERSRHEAQIAREATRKRREAESRARAGEAAKRLKPDAVTYFRGYICCIGFDSASKHLSQEDAAKLRDKGLHLSDYGAGETWEDALSAMCRKEAAAQLAEEHERQIRQRADILERGVLSQERENEPMVSKPALLPWETP
jgi:hypothetical protein